jgi:phage terminase large subunit GpA-like protein
VFPSFLRRSKENTLKTKSFLGSKLHTRGGKAAKNYRRLTVDVVYNDELSGFDSNIEKEGSPVRLSAKRLEGSLFPKHIKGSTPKLKGHCLIDAEHDAAQWQFKFHVPCPHCDREHTLEWGGRKVHYGFKWQGNDPSTVQHLCPHCGVGYTQAEYLSVWERGRWITADGIWIDPWCRFFTAGGAELPPPQSIAFSLWTAYSPQATWASIVKEFLEAVAAMRKGDHAPMQTWMNTTRGEAFAFEGARTDAAMLKARATPYRLRRVPRLGLVLVCGVDIQDNRFAIVVWAFGRDEQSWVVDHRVMFCDPASWASWLALDTYLSTRFPHEGGQSLAIDAVAIDIGGHYTHQVYRYVMLRESRRVHAVQGSSIDSRPIIAGTPTKQDVNADGQVIKDGVKLWPVGTDTAKDLIYNRLRIAQPGPGYVNFSTELGDDFYAELTAEQRVEQRAGARTVFRWVKPNSATRNEVLDCTVYAYFCAARMKLGQYTDAEWRRLEAALNPPTADMFTPHDMPEPLPAPPQLPAEPLPTDTVPADPPPAHPPVALALLAQAPRGRRVLGSVA